MAEEELLKLFEQNWSQRPIFKKGKSGEQDFQEEKEEVVKNFKELERAMSDETMMSSSKTSLFGSSSTDDLFLSPKSVLTRKASPMKLQTILSGKEVREFSIPQRDDSDKEKKKKNNVRTRRGKSMSDLEYEELKGFMDLGFVFSEEDNKDSNLVSILPGLQRLLKKDDDGEVKVTEEDKNSHRPYLSEAWDQSGGRKGKRSSKPEIKWSVNEVDLKDHLKLWAHAVASKIQ